MFDAKIQDFVVYETLKITFIKCFVVFNRQTKQQQVIFVFKTNNWSQFTSFQCLCVMRK